jgi:hypothetical protein
MRRILSIFLVLFFGLGPLTATLQASDDASLPACCRRNGAHHCAMSAALQSWMLRTQSRTPAFSAPSHCPLYPGHSGAFSAPAHALIRTPQGLPALLQQSRITVLYRAILFDAPLRAHANRGPPASLSA